MAHRQHLAPLNLPRLWKRSTRHRATTILYRSWQRTSQSGAVHGILTRRIHISNRSHMRSTSSYNHSTKTIKLQIFAYNSKGNGSVERGHRDVPDGLSKATRGGFKRWTRKF